MSLSKLHPSLPAPVVHNSHMPASASKSHVLAGVQDAYWSDEEAEDEDCPLCLEEMDLSDLNFKPCLCGYQICRFCWHHIKENLNGRCPACRREYSDEAVQFKPVNKDDLKRLTQQKKQRERERKDLDALGRRHLTNVRIVQRNVVYVVGLGSRFAREELIPTLRSNDYFGQYGKITKILLVKRTPPGGRAPILGLYISYYRREDAARAIQAVDGAPSPSGGGEVMRASHGTTKYCMAFLRGVSCTNHGCMDLHEWGDEKDCFTKEDLATLKHTMKDTENRQRPGTGVKKPEEAGLPRSAGWGTKPAFGPSAAANASGISARSTRRGHRSTRTGATGEGRTQQALSLRQPPPQERKQSAKPPSQASLSRPSTPGIAGLPQRPATPTSVVPIDRQHQQRKDPQTHLPPRSPTSSVAVESDAGSLEAVSASPSLSAPRVATPPVANRPTPPGLPSAPPGLMTPPPGISVPPTQLSSPLVREASTSSYQISTQARALLDDVMNRREGLPSSTSFSPFPDLDRTLQNLSGGDSNSGGFNFNLDPKLAVDDEQFDVPLPELDSDHAISPGGHFDPFSTGRFVNNTSPFYQPPGLSHTILPSRALFEGLKAPGAERTSSSSSGYTGSFNPFGGASEPPETFGLRPSPAPDDDTSRRVSRFGFARERQSSSGFLNSGTSSPLLSANTSMSSLPLVESANPPSGASPHAPWSFQRQPDLPPPPGLGMSARAATPSSARGSPLAAYAHAQASTHSAQSAYTPQASRFQPFDMHSSEQSLRDMLGIGRDRFPTARTTGATDNYSVLTSGTSFQDPAIMSSVPYMASPGNDGGFHFSPPAESGHLSNLPQSKLPGHSFQQGQHFTSPQSSSIPGQSLSSLALGNGPATSSLMAHGQFHNQGPLAHTSSPPFVHISLPAENEATPDPPYAPSPMLSAADFPALPTASASSDTHSLPRTARSAQQTRESSPIKDEKAQTKVDRKVAKRAEKAAERERVAKEKAAERERVAKEKAEQRERAAREKAEEKERLVKQKAEKDRLAKERSDREAEKERLERERIAMLRKAEVNKAAKNKAQAKAKQSQNSDVAVKAETARPSATRSQSNGSGPVTDTVSPMPILSKMPKKNKPTTKPIRIPREDDMAHDTQSSVPSAVTANSETAQLPTPKLPNVSEVARSSLEAEVGISRVLSGGALATRAKSLAELFEEISVEKGQYYLDNHPFFDMGKINSTGKASLDYNTMARALSAFPANGASFADNSSRLNDKTVSSFQQLLETLTQTMSDLVQLLPQSTWGSIFDVLSQDLRNLKNEYALHSSTSFDGLVHDDLPEDTEDEEDLDADALPEPLTPTVDKRAKWMEIQLAKLEELHREVNLAAVRTILASNDQGWDPRGFLTHVGNTLARFDQLGLVDEGVHKRPMTMDELEKKLVVAKEAVVFAEAELREAMQAMLVNKP